MHKIVLGYHVCFNSCLVRYEVQIYIMLFYITGHISSYMLKIPLKFDASTLSS